MMRRSRGPEVKADLFCPLPSPYLTIQKSHDKLFWPKEDNKYGHRYGHASIINTHTHTHYIERRESGLGRGCYFIRACGTEWARFERVGSVFLLSGCFQPKGRRWVRLSYHFNNRLIYNLIPMHNLPSLWSLAHVSQWYWQIFRSHRPSPSQSWIPPGCDGRAYTAWSVLLTLSGSGSPLIYTCCQFFCHPWHFHRPLQTPIFTFCWEKPK